MHTTHDMHVKVKGQLAEVHSQLTYEFLRLNLRLSGNRNPYPLSHLTDTIKYFNKPYVCVGKIVRFVYIIQPS